MKTSAGIVLYRIINKQLEVFLVHPGGPFWQRKDLGAWSIPKGEYTTEDPLATAKREFEEETGSPIDGHFMPLQPVVLKSGKHVKAWAVAGDIDAASIHSNMIEIEWPPKSGKLMQIPEVDRGAWFPKAIAMQKLNPAQVPFITELVAILKDI